MDDAASKLTGIYREKGSS